MKNQNNEIKPNEKHRHSFHAYISDNDLELFNGWLNQVQYVNGNKFRAGDVMGAIINAVRKDDDIIGKIKSELGV